MVINEEVRKIREKKSNIYQGLRIVLSVGRKIGRELCDFESYGLKSDDFEFIDCLLEFLTGERGSFSELKSFKTYERLIEEVLNKNFNDDVSCILYKVEHIGNDLVFALIYNDKIDASFSCFDTYVINTNGEKR